MVVVVVVVEKKGGMVTMCHVGDISTVAARFGNSQASIIN